MGRAELAERVRVYLQGYDVRYIEGVEYKVIPTPPDFIPELLQHYTTVSIVCLVAGIVLLLAGFFFYRWYESFESKGTTLSGYISLLLLFVSAYSASTGASLGVGGVIDLWTIYTAPKSFVETHWEEHADNRGIK